MCYGLTLRLDIRIIKRSLLHILKASSTNENTTMVTMDDFHILRVIGRGSYAKVILVEQKRSKRLYAMKVIKKELVNDDEVSKHVG